MAYEPIPKQIGHINLDNYYLEHQTQNKSVFVHKKFLPKSIFQRKTYRDTEINNDCVKPDTQEKCQQFDIEHDIQRRSNERKEIKTNLHDDSVLAQTVKFAKDLAPKVIPPSREFSPTPVIYTIKASKKSGKKISKLSSPRSDHDSMPNVHKPKDTRYTKKYKTDVRSSKEDISQSTNDNTSDDIQTNQSSSMSLSEVLENNLNKTTQNHRKRKQNLESKMDISDGLDGIATAIDYTNRKIKIHVMNETERNIFYESLKVPIVDTVKEYLNEIKNPSGIAAEMKIISQTLASNMEKLDYAIHTLEKIERKITDYSDKKTRVIMSPKPISSKASRLDELAEDMPEIREVHSTEEEDFEAVTCKKTMVSRSAVVAMNPNQDHRSNKMAESYDHGESGPLQMNVIYSQLGVKQERPNRIPARFCWTDGNRNN